METIGSKSHDKIDQFYSDDHNETVDDLPTIKESLISQLKSDVAKIQNNVRGFNSFIISCSCLFPNS